MSSDYFHFKHCKTSACSSLLFSNNTSVVVNGKTSVEIVVSVSSERGAMILQGVFSILLFVALFLMGIDIDLRVVKGVLRKPIGPAIGFFSQFVFMPLASYGIAMGLLKQGDFKLLQVFSLLQEQQTLRNHEFSREIIYFGH